MCRAIALPERWKVWPMATGTGNVRFLIMRNQKGIAGGP